MQTKNLKIMHRKTMKNQESRLWIPAILLNKKALTFLWVVIVLTSWIYVSYSSSFFRQEKQALYYYGVRKHYKKAHTSIKSVCHKKCDFGFYLPNLLLFMLLLFYWSVNECKKPRVRRFGSYSVSKHNFFLISGFRIELARKRRCDLHPLLFFSKL